MQGRKKNRRVPAAVVIVMGVSGSGKSTVAALVAQRLQGEFEDADWFHPPANVRQDAPRYFAHR
jgi:shikimate kinase